MSKKKKNISELLHETTEDLKRFHEDLAAFMNGGIGPTQQEYINKINANWNAYNFIVVFGHVYRLTDRIRYKDNGAMYSPCHNCELSEYCAQDTDKKLCAMLQAETNQWFEDVGELVVSKRGVMKVNPWLI